MVRLLARLGLTRITGAVLAAAVTTAAGSIYYAAEAREDVGAMTERAEQWERAYEWLEENRKRMAQAATEWRNRSQESAQQHESRIRELARYNAQLKTRAASEANTGSPGAPIDTGSLDFCLDARVPGDVVDLMRSEQPGAAM